MKILSKYRQTAMSLVVMLVNVPFAVAGDGVHIFLVGAFSVFALWDFCEERR